MASTSTAAPELLDDSNEFYDLKNYDCDSFNIDVDKLNALLLTVMSQPVLSTGTLGSPGRYDLVKRCRRQGDCYHVD